MRTFLAAPGFQAKRGRQESKRFGGKYFAEVLDGSE
jgi:hypothetical protein